MSKVRVCFLGTPEFAVTCLKQLLKDEHYEIVGVVTQPDRPAGRKLMLTPSPVKSLALAKGLRVIAPESVNTEMILQEVQKWGAEVAVVVAFGQIVSQKFLDSFRFGAVNVHASLLPKWRGAAPIQRAIEAGEDETGVALQKMVKKLDAGDVIGLRRIAINGMNAQQLHDELAKLGADLLHVELMDYVRGNLVPTPQDESKVTCAKKIEKSEAEIKWSLTAAQIHNRIQAFVMGPGSWTLLHGKKMKIYSTQVDPSSTKEKPGKILQISSDFIKVATGNGSLKILELQPESRNRQKVSEFIKSQTIKEGDFFG